MKNWIEEGKEIVEEIIEKDMRMEGKIEILNEMGNWEKIKTGLPVNIWIDEYNATHDSHPGRIKFQNNYDGHMEPVGKLIPMGFDGGIEKKIFQRKILESDINEIRNFVFNNNYLLRALFNGALSMNKKERQKYLIKGGELISKDEFLKKNEEIKALIPDDNNKAEKIGKIKDEMDDAKILEKFNE